jgi:hypothetical protein
MINKYLTKEIRHKIYEVAYKMYIEKDGAGSEFMCMCISYGMHVVLSDKAKIPFANMSCNEKINYFPEIMEYKPVGDPYIWFPTDSKGRAKRISIFKKALKNTE